MKRSVRLLMATMVAALVVACGTTVPAGPRGAKSMIVKVYTRVFVNDIDAALPSYTALVGRGPDFRVRAGSVTVAAVGNFLVIGGADEALEPLRTSHGTIVVDDLEQARRYLEQTHAVITQPITPGPTGRSIHARHADGNTFEYVQWNDEVARQVPEERRR